MARLPALPWVRAFVTEGLSANAAYRTYQAMAHEADLQGMRRQDFLRLYSQTRSLRAIAQTAMQLPKDQRVPADHIIDRNTINARGYGQWVAIYQRTSGGEDFLSTPFLIKTNQPITPAEAEARALDYLEQQPDEYNRVTLGVGFLGTEHFVPMPR